jgi:hypothetical protein
MLFYNFNPSPCSTYTLVCLQTHSCCDLTRVRLNNYRINFRKSGKLIYKPTVRCNYKFQPPPSEAHSAGLNERSLYVHVCVCVCVVCVCV